MAKAPALIPEEIQPILLQGNEVVPQANLDRMEVLVAAAEIRGPEDFEAINGLLVGIKTMQQAWQTFWAPTIEGYHKLHAGALEAQRAKKDKLQSIREILERKLKAGLLAEADKQRRAQAAIAKTVEQGKVALSDKAKELLREGDVAGARLLQQQVATVTVPALPIEAPKLDDVTIRAKYNVTVTDLKALVIAVAQGKVPLEALKPDESFLRKRAIEQGEHLDYPGVKVTPDMSFGVSCN